jgi:hypothetical protein
MSLGGNRMIYLGTKEKTPSIKAMAVYKYSTAKQLSLAAQ